MTDVEKVRLKIGDRDVGNALFTDVEIESFLDDEGTVLAASAAACEALAARFAPGYDVSTDDQSLKRSQRATAFAKLGETFRDRAEGQVGIGTIKTKKVDGYNDTDVDNEEIAGTSAGGRVRAGYENPDQIP